MDLQEKDMLAEQTTQEQPENKAPFLVRNLYEAMSILVSAITIVMLVFTFAFRLVGVMQKSMQPTLYEGQSLIVTAFMRAPQYKDIVIIVKPDLENPLVKRVIATEGQTVDINFDSGEITVDGEKLKEPYIAELTHRSFDVEFPLTVPQDCVFVLGDNRNNSSDSRDSSIGCVPEKFLLGKVLLRVGPDWDVYQSSK